jgi:hypothetical protein
MILTELGLWVMLQLGFHDYQVDVVNNRYCFVSGITVWVDVYQLSMVDL